MARKINVSQGAVNTACDALMSAGKNVTKAAVIGIVGGSFSTVGPMVNTWKEEQAAKDVPLIEIPDTVTKAMQRATADIWGAASTLAGESVERIQHEAAEAIAQAKAELSEYAGEVSRLENELEQAAIKATNTAKSLDKALAQVSELTATNAALEARLVERDSELERLRTDTKTLQNELIGLAKSTKGVAKGSG